MAKITPRKELDKTVHVKTSDKKKDSPGEWWNAGNSKDMAEQLMGTAAFLKEQNSYRYRKATINARLYGNMPLSTVAGANFMSLNQRSTLPSDRPTMSVITSCTDTIVSRLTQNRPRPLFLTDDGDYKQRKLAKQLNNFISGELYQTKAYQKGEIALRDACVFDTGVIKVLEDSYKRVSLERRLSTQILVDANEAFLGDPRQMIEMALVDRALLMALFPKYADKIMKAEKAYPEQSGSDRSISDQVMVIEGWRLPSGDKSGDGLHAFACSEGPLDDEEWDKKNFPFAFLQYVPPQVGFWGISLADRQLGNQTSINRLLMTIHKSINLVGVPRVFLEKGSKVAKATLNNEVGSIVEFTGTKPSYEVAPCVPAELYQEVNNVIQRSYQEEGISQMASEAKKPAGLNSGEAIRSYDDIQTDRLASLSRRYENFYIDLAYLIIDKAKDICERDGAYQTVYPDKGGSHEIDLPESKLLDNPFVIQCFDVSSLPKDPSGRLQKITEMMQAGLITPQEGRRQLGFPDFEQEDNLANAGEERILQILDEIAEDGKYTPPDPFMDLPMAKTKVVQYYNLYTARKLEEKRAQMLRDFYSQVLALQGQAASAAMPQQGMAPQAAPMPPPQSDMIPNVTGAAPMAANQ